jgi:hypothetical protein
MDVLFGAPIALTLLAKKLGKEAGTADLGELTKEVSEKMGQEQEKQAEEEAIIRKLEEQP